MYFVDTIMIYKNNSLMFFIDFTEAAKVLMKKKTQQQKRVNSMLQRNNYVLQTKKN